MRELRSRGISRAGVLRGKALAAFGTAGLDDATAANRRHAGAITMTPLTHEHTRLESPFHVGLRSLNRFSRGEVYIRGWGRCQRNDPRRIFRRVADRSDSHDPFSTRTFHAKVTGILPQ